MMGTPELLRGGESDNVLASYGKVPAITNMNDNGKKCCVLIVDDEPKVLRFIEIDLKVRGFRVVMATSGEEALKVVGEAKPDVMLLDIIMPDIDGFEVLRRLRGFSQLPVIAFSASHRIHDEAMQLGANDFIAKPFRPEDLVRRIETVLSR